MIIACYASLSTNVPESGGFFKKPAVTGTGKID
jgi:hypothetical protein